jgi:hypothetical protein
LELAEGEYRALVWAGAAGWVAAVLFVPVAESLEVLRFINGLKEGPLKAFDFFYWSVVVVGVTGLGSSILATGEG